MIISIDTLKSDRYLAGLRSRLTELALDTIARSRLWMEATRPKTAVPLEGTR